MKLIVHELGLEDCRQKWTVGTSNVLLEYVRVHLYKHGSPSGSVYIQLQDSSGKKIKDSNVVAINTLPTTNGAYFHGMIRFQLQVGLRASTTYSIQVKGSSYTYSTSALIGVCTDFNGERYSTDGNALDMEFWENKFATKGDY